MGSGRSFPKFSLMKEGEIGTGDARGTVAAFGWVSMRTIVFAIADFYYEI